MFSRSRIFIPSFFLSMYDITLKTTSNWINGRWTGTNSFQTNVSYNHVVDFTCFFSSFIRVVFQFIYQTFYFIIELNKAILFFSFLFNAILINYKWQHDLFLTLGWKHFFHFRNIVSFKDFHNVFSWTRCHNIIGDK